MTRLAVLADLHGNLPALEAVVRDMAQFPVDQVVVAGDVINWGPFSSQVMDEVTLRGWAVIRGNNEFYLLDYGTPRAPAEWCDPDNYSVLPWLVRQMTGPQRARIASWPDTLSLRFRDAAPLRVIHGSARSPWEGIFPILTDGEIAEMLEGVEETTVVAGHTHLAMDRRVGRWHVLNPGTVGVPLDGRPGACYMLLEGDEEGWRPTFRRVGFDLEPLLQEFERQGFVETCGVVGDLVVEEFRTARLALHPFLQWRMRHCPGAPFQRGLLEEFYRVNRWDYTLPAYHVNQER